MGRLAQTLALAPTTPATQCSQKNPMLTQIRTATLMMMAIGFNQAQAQNLLAYYQIGLNPETWVQWDTYVIDLDSISAEREYIKYKSFRISPTGTNEVQELRADCKSNRRGLASDTSMYSTYEGALTGEEVRSACRQALKLGVLKQ